MGSRRHLFVVMATSCIVAMPFIGGCGGADDPGASNVAQCSGSSCPPSGPNTTPTTPTSLCPGPTVALSARPRRATGPTSDRGPRM